MIAKVLRQELSENEVSPRISRYPSYVGAISKDPIPLHGIHYIELRIKSQTLPSLPQSQLKQVFFGLTSISQGELKNQKDKIFEDCHRSKSSLLLNCYDSSFWSAGHPQQVFSNKFIKIKQPLDNQDVIRIAIDFRHANQFAQMWKENQILGAAGLDDFGIDRRRNARGAG